MPWFPEMNLPIEITMKHNYGNLKRKGIIGRFADRLSSSKSSDSIEDIKEKVNEPFIPTIEQK